MIATRVYESVSCSEDADEELSMCDPQKLLDVLGDEESIQIVSELDSPMTVAELADEIDLPQSTAYRKIHGLEQAGLITSRGKSSNGRPPTRYTRSIETVTIQLDEPGVSCAPVIE